MPRANRFILPGYIYHITHRCHDRRYLMKFARDKNGYRKRLLAALKKYSVSILAYNITSNHVHLILWSSKLDEISRFMQEVAGEFAQDYNRRKKRSGGYWEGRFHATMVEGGLYFQRCMVYVDLNMVRCFVVAHPKEWDWCGYQEIMGIKKRNCLLDVEKILELMGGPDLEHFRKNYEFMIAERIRKDEARNREPEWTEELAVGSKAFVEKLQPKIRGRAETEVIETSSGSWILREEVAPYGTIIEVKK